MPADHVRQSAISTEPGTIVVVDEIQAQTAPTSSSSADGYNNSGAIAAIDKSNDDVFAIEVGGPVTEYTRRGRAAHDLRRQIRPDGLHGHRRSPGDRRRRADPRGLRLEQANAAAGGRVEKFMRAAGHLDRRRSASSDRSVTTSTPDERGPPRNRQPRRRCDHRTTANSNGALDQRWPTRVPCDQGPTSPGAATSR